MVAAAPISRSRTGSPGAFRSAATQASPVRSPATGGMPAAAKRAAASSSSSSGSVEATITGTGLTAVPARMPSSTASQLSSALLAIPGGRS